MLIVIFLDCNSCSRTFGLHAHLDPLEYKGIILDLYIFSHFKIFSPKYNGGGVENTQACGHQLPWELCYVQGRAPQNSGQRPHKLCPTHSTGKKGGIPQRIPGLKGLPVIMANGSNLVFWGVNELVVSVAKPGMTI